jgi:tetratricopeptide (TPR) repeat protein
MLLYCLHCNKGVYQAQAIAGGDGTKCPKCKKLLIYLGREEAQVSPKDILAHYDQTHPYRPTEKLTGKSGTFRPIIMDTEMMECEEMLVHNPQNVEALYHLAMIYKTRYQLTLSKDYFNKILIHENTHLEALRQLAHISMIESQFDTAIQHLQTIKTLYPDHYLDQFHLAVAYYLGHHHDDCHAQLQALTHHPLEESLKHQINDMLSQLFQD